MTDTERCILVTGASAGIGRAIAMRLASNGFTVAVHYGRNADGAAQTLGEIEAAGGNGRVLSFDVADAGACESALAADIAEHGCYYGVVCNAGVSRDAAFPMLSQEDWRQVIDVNLNGLYNVLKPIVMPMIGRRQPGRIVTISSVAGQMGNRGQSNYSASKAGIIGATKSLAIELAKRKITVNCVSPGLIETEMTEKIPLDKILDAIPARRMGKPEEVAALVAFLCSDDAAYITRQVLAVNGGLC